MKRRIMMFVLSLMMDLLIIIINEGINFLTEENCTVIAGTRFLKIKIFKIE